MKNTQNQNKTTLEKGWTLRWRITFDHDGERVFIKVRTSEVTLWEILECIEQQQIKKESFWDKW